MSNILTLTKVLIKNNVFAFSGKSKKGKGSSTRGNAIGVIIALVFCVACLGIPMIMALNGLLQEYNLSEIILTFALPVGGITSLIFGAFSIISVFYFNKDSEHLLPFPIKSSELLVSKFLAALVSEYLILFMFIFPMIFGVGIGIGAGALYYLYSIIICLLMPIIPSVIVAIFLMLMNKIFNFSRRKDLFMYIMMGIILVFSFAYSFGLEFIVETDDTSIVSFINGDMRNYLKIGKLLFPFFNSATYALLHCNEFIGIASLITYIGLNVLAMVVLYYLGDKLYVKGLTNNRGNNRKKANLEKIYKESKGGVMWSLIKKEWLFIKRTPIFMLNTVIANFMFPLLFVVSFVIAMSSGGKETLDMFLGNINFDNGAILLILTGALLFIVSMSSGASCSISKDGKSASYMKMIPVSFKTQIDAKLGFSMIVDLILIMCVEIPLIIFVKAPWYFWIMLNIPLILLLIVINYLSILIDLRKPRLDWSEESEAVKQNLNVLWGMILAMVFSALIVVLGLWLYKFNINIFLLFAISSVILLAMSLTISCWIGKYQGKLFDKVG